jgi:hypothetical protein
VEAPLANLAESAFVRFCFCEAVVSKTSIPGSNPGGASKFLSKTQSPDEEER